MPTRPISLLLALQRISERRSISSDMQAATMLSDSISIEAMGTCSCFVPIRHDSCNCLQLPGCGCPFCCSAAVLPVGGAAVLAPASRTSTEAADACSSAPDFRNFADRLPAPPDSLPTHSMGQLAACLYGCLGGATNSRHSPCNAGRHEQRRQAGAVATGSRGCLPVSHIST